MHDKQDVHGPQCSPEQQWLTTLRHSGTFCFRGCRATMYGHDLYTCTKCTTYCPNTQRTITYMVAGLGSQRVFKKFGHFLFRGDGTTLYDYNLYTIWCLMIQGARINIWFRGGKLSGFEITSNFYFWGGGEGEEENDTSD